MSNLTARTSWLARSAGSGYEARSIQIANAQQLYEGGYVQLDAGGNLVPYSYLQSGVDGGFCLGYVQPSSIQYVKPASIPPFAPYLYGDTSGNTVPNPQALVFTGEEEQFDVAVTGLTGQTQLGALVYLPLQDNGLTLTSGGAPGSALITGGSVAGPNGGAGNIDNGAHTYAFTAVTPFGETGPLASSVVTVVALGTNGKATVTLPTSVPKGTTMVNVYRSLAGTTTPFYLVSSQDVIGMKGTVPTYAAATITDNSSDATITALGASPAASNGWPIGEISGYLATGFGNVKLWSYDRRRAFASK
jgi:hypothetical protein